MSLVHRRQAGRDLEDPSREPSDLSVVSQASSSPAVELIMQAPVPPPLPQQILDLPPSDELEISALRRKYARFPAPKKGLSDWALWFMVTAGISVIAVLFVMLYLAAKAPMDDIHELTAMLVKHKAEIETAVVSGTSLLTNTTADAAKRYVGIINDANNAVDQVKALLNDPQTQENIRVLTDGISKGNFKKIGQLAGVILKVSGAVAQSAGDNGITLSVGNWKAYVNQSDLTVND